MACCHSSAAVAVCNQSSASTQAKMSHDSNEGVRSGYSQLDWAHNYGSIKPDPKVANRTISLKEVSKHSSNRDAWTVIHGKVYNITRYLRYHPGGVNQLLRAAGRDATALFDQIHAWVNAEAVLRSCQVGVLDPNLKNEEPANQRNNSIYATSSTLITEASHNSFFKDFHTFSTHPAQSDPTLATDPSLSLLDDPSSWYNVTCIKIEDISSNGRCKLLKFELPDDNVLGLRAGQHIRVRRPDTVGIIREYTPVSSINAKGFFELAIKPYADGALSEFLCNYTVGDTLEISGPYGQLKFGLGTLQWASGCVLKPSHLCLIGGGSGVTPILQLAQEASKYEHIRTYVVCIHSDTNSIMLKSQFEQLAAFEHIRIVFLTTKELADSTEKLHAKDSAAVSFAAPIETRFGVGRPTAKLLSSFLPSPDMDTFAAFCGPPGFNRTVDDLLRDLYFPAQYLFEF